MADDEKFRAALERVTRQAERYVERAGLAPVGPRAARLRPARARAQPGEVRQGLLPVPGGRRRSAEGPREHLSVPHASRGGRPIGAMRVRAVHEKNELSHG
jgi:hypothetical protein